MKPILTQNQYSLIAQPYVLKTMIFLCISQLYLHRRTKITYIANMAAENLLMYCSFQKRQYIVYEFAHKTQNLETMLCIARRTASFSQMGGNKNALASQQ